MGLNELVCGMLSPKLCFTDAFSCARFVFPCFVPLTYAASRLKLLSRGLPFTSTSPASELCPALVTRPASTFSRLVLPEPAPHTMHSPHTMHRISWTAYHAPHIMDRISWTAHYAGESHSKKIDVKGLEPLSKKSVAHPASHMHCALSQRDDGACSECLAEAQPQRGKGFTFARLHVDGDRTLAMCSF